MSEEQKCPSFMIMKKHFNIFLGVMVEGDWPDEIIADEIPNLDMARGFIHGYIKALNTTLSANYEDVSADFRAALEDAEKRINNFSSGFYLCILNQDQDSLKEEETEFMFFDYNSGSFDMKPKYNWFDVND